MLTCGDAVWRLLESWVGRVLMEEGVRSEFLGLLFPIEGFKYSVEFASSSGFMGFE